MEKVIITAAITGSRMMRDIAPHIPITPEESPVGHRGLAGGASIVHIHVRDTPRRDSAARTSTSSAASWRESGKRRISSSA